MQSDATVAGDGDSKSATCSSRQSRSSASASSARWKRRSSPRRFVSRPSACRSGIAAAPSLTQRICSSSARRPAHRSGWRWSTRRRERPAPGVEHVAEVEAEETDVGGQHSVQTKPEAADEPEPSDAESTRTCEGH